MIAAQRGGQAFPLSGVILDKALVSIHSTTQIVSRDRRISLTNGNLPFHQSRKSDKPHMMHLHVQVTFCPFSLLFDSLDFALLEL